MRPTTVAPAERALLLICVVFAALISHLLTQTQAGTWKCRASVQRPLQIVKAGRRGLRYDQNLRRAADGGDHGTADSRRAVHQDHVALRRFGDTPRLLSNR